MENFLHCDIPFQRNIQVLATLHLSRVHSTKKVAPTPAIANVVTSPNLHELLSGREKGEKRG